MDAGQLGLGTLSVVEAALEAWAECEPVAFALPERHALSLLFTLGAHLPGNEQGLGGRAQKLEALVPLLHGDPGTSPLKLVANDGNVHFLNFWRTLSEVARLVAGPCGIEVTPDKSAVQGCVEGVEQLRNEALDLLEASGGQGVAPADLATALQRIGQSSTVPMFWKEVEKSVGNNCDREIHLEELTVLLLSWLHDALMWQHSPAVNLRTGMLPVNMRTGMLDDPEGPFAAFDSTILPSASQTLRPGSQMRGKRPQCALMASDALVLDLEEQWRAAGMMSTTDECWRLLGTPSLTPREPKLEAVAEGDGTPAAAQKPASEFEAVDEPFLPPKPPRPGTCDRLQPPGPPAPLLVIRNFRTAMIPLDLTPRPDEISGVVESSMGGNVGTPVFVHVYDVSHEALVQRLNAVLAHRHSPLKFGGVFHAGVEVSGSEWSFGRTESQTATGVTCVDPKEDPQHHFRQTVSLPNTQLSEEEIDDLIDRLKREYLGRDYDLLRRNCCHFADDFCQRLGVGRIPGWVYRLARIGARIDFVLRPTQALRNQEEAQPLLA